MCFFVVPGNGQVVPGMPDIAAPQLINTNIYSIQAEMAEHKTNIEQEMQVVERYYTNMDTDSKPKQGTNGQNNQNNANKSINYFYSSSNVDADKRKSSEMMQKVHNTFGDALMAMGALKAHSLCSLSQIENNTK